MRSAQEEQDAVLSALRQCAPDLARRGVRSLRLFGSIARGEADDASDVDLAGEFDTDGGFSLLDLVRIERELSTVLGRRVDLVTLDGLKPFIRERVEREGILAF